MPRTRRRVGQARPTSAVLMWRNSLEAAHDRWQQRITPPDARTSEARANPDLFHCLRVLRSSAGQGFAFALTQDQVRRSHRRFPAEILR